MSGIAGIIHFDGWPVDPGLVEKMTSVMAARGPDGVGHWTRGAVALGQCMLRTTPESLEERQPLTDDDESLVLIMDGRVDNCDDLRRELRIRGAVLRDRSDAELVLKSYEVWGEECPDRIIGEFAFFIWDARRQRLFGARDAAGTRHFHYGVGNGWFAFASEIKGLLALGRIEPRLNESRLLDYLVVEFDRDDEVGTFFHGVNRMPAGHAMLATKAGVKVWRWWNPGSLPENRFESPDECAEAFLDQLRIAVKCRLRSIGPVGAMLSGGLDSSSIVGLIRKEFQGELQQPLRTFSLIRHDRENCPDWRGIRAMLNDGWITPTIITSATAAEVCLPYLDDIRNLNEPFALSQGFPDSIVYNAARKSGCRVVLDGMAGDLLFYSPARSLECVFRKKAFLQVLAVLAAWRRHHLGGGLRMLALMSLHMITPETARALYRKLRDGRTRWRKQLNEVPGDLGDLLHLEFAKRTLVTKLARRRQTGTVPRPGHEQSRHAQIFTSGMLSFAHEVNGQNAMSMGVEPRSPYSDRRMIEFAIRMPLGAKLATPLYKHTLRRCMAGILPEGVRWRRDVGQHPGWTFYEQLIAETVRSAPDLWSFPGRSDRLKKWIDPLNLARACRDYDRSATYATGFNLFTLAVLAQWIACRPDSFSSARSTQ